MKNLQKLLDKSLEYHNGYIRNNGKLEYSERNYGYLCHEIEDVQVGYLKLPFNEVDSDYSEELRKDNFTLTEEEATVMLTHRIDVINEELKESKKLKVGDVIYPEYAMSDQLSRPLVIDRVTKTQAIAGEHKFKIDNKYYIKPVGGGMSYSRTHYYLESDVIKKRYIRQRNVRYLKNFDWNTLESDNELSDIVNKLINYKKN
jgi:hypothetical protein